MGLQGGIPPGLVPTYATTGDLPASARDGAIAVVLADHQVYIFNGSTWETQSAGAENFSYNEIVTDKTIPQYQQMVVSGGINITATLTIVGSLAVLNG